MLRTIIEKELLEKILTFRFVAAFALSLGLTTISALVLSNDYADELADYHARVKLHDETSNQRATYVDKKPSALSALFRGITKHSAASMRLHIDVHLEPIEAIDDNPFSVLFPTVDLTFIIGVVMSLLALLFAYDAVCGERETGTLALMASNPLPKPTLILGKWLGGYLGLITPCLVGILPALLLLSTHPQIQLTPTDWSALGLILLGALAYLGCFFALAALVAVGCLVFFTDRIVSSEEKQILTGAADQLR